MLPGGKFDPLLPSAQKQVGGDAMNPRVRRMLNKAMGEQRQESATKMQGRFRSLLARREVREKSAWKKFFYRFVQFVLIPCTAIATAYGLFLTIRCHVPILPLPSECEIFFRDHVPSTTWRQKINCCDDHKVRIPIPLGAEFHDMVAMQWYEPGGGKRFISYHHLDGQNEFEVSFALPWKLVGAGGCLPRPERSCQFGNTPYVEMAAVQMSCEAEDKECFASIPWSWGAVPFTIPRHSRAGDLDGNRNLMYMASFPPDFQSTVPDHLPLDPPKFPLELVGTPGIAKDHAIETYIQPPPVIYNRLQADTSSWTGAPVGNAVYTSALGLAMVGAAVRRARHHTIIL